MIKMIKDLLIQEDRSQAWLGRQCGVSSVMVHYWLTEKHKPSVLHKKLIAKAFNLQYKDLFNDLEK